MHQPQSGYSGAPSTSLPSSTNLHYGPAGVSSTSFSMPLASSGILETTQSDSQKLLGVSPAPVVLQGTPAIPQGPPCMHQDRSTISRSTPGIMKAASSSQGMHAGSGKHFS